MGLFSRYFLFILLLTNFAHAGSRCRWMFFPDRLPWRPVTVGGTGTDSFMDLRALDNARVDLRRELQFCQQLCERYNGAYSEELWPNSAFQSCNYQSDPPNSSWLCMVGAYVSCDPKNIREE